MNSYLFEERTVAPTQSNATDVLYYFSSNNVYWPTYSMPNCTSYANGRVNQLLALNSLDFPDVQGSAGNAENWGEDGYIGQNWEKGTTPMLGAIPVWSGGSQGGHVAVVEEIHDDGTIKISQSGWDGFENVGNESDPRWWWVTDNLDVHNYSSYTFKYYLYPPYIDGTPTKKKSWIPLAICKALPKNL